MRRHLEGFSEREATCRREHLQGRGRLWAPNAPHARRVCADSARDMRFRDGASYRFEGLCVSPRSRAATAP